MEVHHRIYRRVIRRDPDVSEEHTAYILRFERTMFTQSNSQGGIGLYRPDFLGAVHSSGSPHLLVS
jgi:hypothetical protein